MTCCVPRATRRPSTYAVPSPSLPGRATTTTSHDGAGDMDAVGVPQAVVVGTSMGGAVACELAISDPARVRGMLMLSPAGVDPPVRNAFMRRADAGENPLDLATEADFDRITATVFARPPSVPAPFRRWFVEQAVARRDDTLQIADALRPFLVSGLDGRMGTVRAPTFVLYGTADIVTDPSMMSVFVREIPHARTALIPGAGHVAFSDDFPATVGAMNAFLVAMAFYEPGTMQVEGAEHKLPGWLLQGYREVFAQALPA